MDTTSVEEAPEFKPSVHDALRQPLESGVISIRRAEGSATFPASFQLVVAANPCPCGYGYGKGLECHCSADKRRRYGQRISGPVRDRIDIMHTVRPVSRAEMRMSVGAADATAAVTGRVCEARQRQHARFAGMPWSTNAEVPGYEFRRLCGLDAAAAGLIEEAVGGGRLTQRGADRVTRVAWTLADLAGCAAPRASHVFEALYLRTNGLVGRCFGPRSVE